MTVESRINHSRSGSCNTAIKDAGAEVVIPSRSNAKSPRDTDWSQYKNRNLVERFWSKAKQYRRVATRYDKKAQNFLAFVQLAPIMILLQYPKCPRFTKPCPPA